MVDHVHMLIKTGHCKVASLKLNYFLCVQSNNLCALSGLICNSKAYGPLLKAWDIQWVSEYLIAFHTLVIECSDALEGLLDLITKVLLNFWMECYSVSLDLIQSNSGGSKRLCMLLDDGLPAKMQGVHGMITQWHLLLDLQLALPE